MPDAKLFPRLFKIAKTKGKLQSRSKGSCPAYLWCALVIGYECRLRGFETSRLNDADLRDDSLYCRRGKGSNDNITEWNDDLREAVDFLTTRRTKLWAKKKHPVPVKADGRRLFINESGSR